MRTESVSKLDLYKDLARQLRADIVRTSTAAGSGHPSSSLSAADLMAVLLAGHLRYSFDDPDNPAGDHLIFSKGHASPLIYALFRAAGAIDDAELLTNRKFGSRLQGHPTPMIPWVDVATGSLGQGLPIAVGVAMAGKRPLNAPYHVWTVVGDSESAEGSIWEGFSRAGFEKLDNITAIIDVNRLGQRGPTELEWDMETYKRRIEAFGWNAIVVDGHNLEEIDAAMTEAAERRHAHRNRRQDEEGAGHLVHGRPGRLARQAAQRRAGRGGPCGDRRRARPAPLRSSLPVSGPLPSSRTSRFS